MADVIEPPQKIPGHRSGPQDVEDVGGIFIYHATGASPQCRALLERCEAGDVAGLTSVIVLAEVAHRLLIIEAVTTGLVTGKDVVKKLRARPDLVRLLHVYQEQVERIPLMGIDVAPLDAGTLLRSADMRRQYGLLVNDSIVAAAARGAGVDLLASADADFARVKGLRWYRPTDLGSSGAGQTET
jgi:predicted nucleic acid-binding protein